MKEAKLSIFGTLDAPSAPSSKGFAEFEGGYTFEMRQKRRERFLTVTRDELVEAARTLDIGELVETGANIRRFCIDFPTDIDIYVIPLCFLWTLICLSRESTNLSYMYTAYILYSQRISYLIYCRMTFRDSQRTHIYIYTPYFLLTIMCCQNDPSSFFFLGAHPGGNASIAIVGTSQGASAFEHLEGWNTFRKGME